LPATLLFVVACGGSGAKSEYILAEKLWADKSYAAAAAQFERAFQKDQKGALGKQALYRAATTQYLFVKKYSAALALFRKYLEVDPEGTAARDAEIQIGEILFDRLSQYDAAIQHYRKWLREHPGDPQNPEFLFRVGRSQFYLWQFEDAIQTFESLAMQTAEERWLAEAFYQAGMAHLALAGQGQDRGGATEAEDSDVGMSKKERYKRAIAAFEQVGSRFPKSKAAPEARLGLATAYEELGQWQDAIDVLEPLVSAYPVPQVIKIRMIRIRERLARQNPPLKRKD
jgi:TolA-binding protein